MNEIVEAQVRAGFNVWVRFADGVEGVVDLSEHAGKGVFRAWLDRAFFEKVAPAPHGSLAWPDEIELDPDQIYMTLTGMTVEELFPALARQRVSA